MNVRERERDERWGGRVERRRGKGGRTKVRRDRRESIGAECVPEAGVKKTGGEKKLFYNCGKGQVAQAGRRGVQFRQVANQTYNPYFCFSFLTSTIS